VAPKLVFIKELVLFPIVLYFNKVLVVADEYFLLLEMFPISPIAEFKRPPKAHAV
jgi:hypothetical protein